MSSAPDKRIDAIADLVMHLAAGDFSARSAPSDQADTVDQIMQGLNHIADVMTQQQVMSRLVEQRGSELLAVMMSLASLDYSKRAPVSDDDTIFDALAAGLNMLIDELVAGQETHVRLHQEIIRVQAEAIRELSTPLIPISDDVLVMPLIGSIDTARAQHILQQLLTGIAESHAHTIILDITGVSVVDTQVAKALISAAQAVQLLGAQVVLTGIRPEVAQTLVGLGIELRHIVTRNTLQAGIAYAMRQNGRRL